MICDKRVADEYQSLIDGLGSIEKSLISTKLMNSPNSFGLEG